MTSSINAGKSSAASGDNKHLLRKRPAAGPVARQADETSSAIGDRETCNGKDQRTPKPASGGTTGMTRVYSFGVRIRCHESKRQELTGACKAQRHAQKAWDLDDWREEVQALKASVDLGINTHGGNRHRKSSDRVTESESLATGNTGSRRRSSESSDKAAESESLAIGNTGRAAVRHEHGYRLLGSSSGQGSLGQCSPLSGRMDRMMLVSLQW